MIYVSMQYRLGMWGFLSGSEVAQNGVLNAGLLDQRAALEWIQRNIRAFGEFDWSMAGRLHVTDVRRRRSEQGDDMGRFRRGR